MAKKLHKEKIRRLLWRLVERKIGKGIDFDRKKWAKKLGLTAGELESHLKPLLHKAHQEAKEIRVSPDSIDFLHKRLRPMEKKLSTYKKLLGILSDISLERHALKKKLHFPLKLSPAALAASIEALIDGETHTYFCANYWKKKKFALNNLNDEFIRNILRHLRKALEDGTVYQRTKVMEQRIDALSMELRLLKHKLQLHGKH